MSASQLQLSSCQSIVLDIRVGPAMVERRVAVRKDVDSSDQVATVPTSTSTIEVAVPKCG